MKTQDDFSYYYDNSEEIENEVLLPKEVMNYLACGRSTFYKLVSSGALPAFRVGKMWRVTRKNLIAFSLASSNKAL